MFRSEHSEGQRKIFILLKINLEIFIHPFTKILSFNETVIPRLKGTDGVTAK